jgi:hypothetical protein
MVPTAPYLVPMLYPLSYSPSFSQYFNFICYFIHLDLCGKSTFKSLSKFYSLNHHLEIHLHKNCFLYFLFSNSFSISYVHSREPFSSFIFDCEKSGIEDGYIWMII